MDPIPGWTDIKPYSENSNNTVWMVDADNYGAQPMVGDNIVVIGGTQYAGYPLYGFSATDGSMLWNITCPVMTKDGGAIGYGKWFTACEDLRFRCYDITNGQLLWTGDQGVYPYANFWHHSFGVAYNKLYAGSYDGHLYAFDVNTGKIVWNFFTGNTTETPYGTWPIWGSPVVADGKVYVSSGEHSSVSRPLSVERGHKLYCLDAETGDVIWSVPHYQTQFQGKAIANGYLIDSEEYSGMMYCFGKGQTATTVSLQNNIVAKGSMVLIQGTILDQSPGQKDTACVSKDSMSAWMEYLHWQLPVPTNTTGVPVTLLAIAPDGTVSTIGTATSDMSGIFVYPWTPSSEGLYKITATFSGDDSYWDSWGETNLQVTAGSSTSQAEITQTDNTPLLYGILVAVVAALIVGLVAIFLTLRKR